KEREHAVHRRKPSLEKGYACSAVNTGLERSPAPQGTSTERSSQSTPPRPSRSTTHKRTRVAGPGAVHSTQVGAAPPLPVVSVECSEEMLPAVAKKLNR